MKIILTDSITGISTEAEIVGNSWISMGIVSLDFESRELAIEDLIETFEDFCHTPDGICNVSYRSI